MGIPASSPASIRRAPGRSSSPSWWCWSSCCWCCTRSRRRLPLDFYYRDTDRDVLILRADGGIDSHNAQEFLSQLQRLIEAGARKVLADCSRLGYLSRFGINTLLRE